jgi:hypothetical protein
MNRWHNITEHERDLKMTTATENTAKLAAVLNCKGKFILARLKALDLAAVCGRCCGSGRYSYNQMHGDTCYGCGGCGVKMPKITAKLVKDASEAVAAGKLQPYLDQLAANAEAKKLGDNLLNEYGAASEFEKPLIEEYCKSNNRRNHFTIGTRRGYAIRGVMHAFEQAAQSAYSSARYTKDAAERKAWQEIGKIFREAMLNAPEVYGVSRFDATEVIDTHEIEFRDWYELTKLADKDAWKLKAALAEKYSVKWPKMG